MRSQKCLARIRSIVLPVIGRRQIQQGFSGIGVERNGFSQRLYSECRFRLLEIIEIRTSEKKPVARVRRFQNRGALISRAGIEIQIVSRKSIANAEITEKHSQGAGENDDE